MVCLAQRPSYLVLLGSVEVGRLPMQMMSESVFRCSRCQPRVLTWAPCARKEEIFSREAQCFASLFLLNIRGTQPTFNRYFGSFAEMGLT